jgi:hypothetical protein
LIIDPLYFVYAGKGAFAKFLDDVKALERAGGVLAGIN